MSIALIFVAAAFGARANCPQVTAASVITPSEFLANVQKYFVKQGLVTVRFRVGSVGSQTVDNVASRTKSQRIILHSGVGDEHKSFDVAILPEAQAALKRLGIVNLAKHFSGKVIEVQGRVIGFVTVEYGALIESMSYYVEVSHLEQFNAVE
jgi:hypothetical protein